MTTGRINQVANPSVRQSPHATPRPGHTHRPTPPHPDVDGEAAMRCAAGGANAPAVVHSISGSFCFFSGRRRGVQERARAYANSFRTHGIPFPPSRPDPIHRTQKHTAVPTAGAACTRQPRTRGTPHVAAARPPEAEPEGSKPNPTQPGEGAAGKIRCKGPQRSRVLAMPYSPPNRRLLSNPRRALRSARLGRRDQLKSDHRTDGRLH